MDLNPLGIRISFEGKEVLCTLFLQIICSYFKYGHACYLQPSIYQKRNIQLSVWLWQQWGRRTSPGAPQCRAGINNISVDQGSITCTGSQICPFQTRKSCYLALSLQITKEYTDFTSGSLGCRDSWGTDMEHTAKCNLHHIEEPVPSRVSPRNGRKSCLLETGARETRAASGCLRMPLLGVQK